jgi:multisite-specific tRNA:(cytosine-C5)-methyltransferase
MAAEQDAIAATDKVEQARLEVLEDEDRKIAEAMPERDGDAVGDHYNTTV